MPHNYLYSFVKNSKSYKIDLKSLIIVLAAVTSIGAIKPVDIPNMEHVPVDLLQYRQMGVSAPQLNPQTWEPYAYRILGPWLSGVLFTDVDLGFRVLNTMFLVFLALAMWGFLLAYKIDPKIALPVTIAFLLSRYYYTFLAYEFYRIDDTISLFLLWISIILTIKGHLKYLLPLLVLGLLAREIALLWIPVSFFIILKSGGKRNDFTLWSIYTIILFGVFVLLRKYIPAQGGIALADALNDDWNKLFSPWAIGKQLFVANTPFFLLPLIFFRKFFHYFKKHPEIFVLIGATYLSSLFGHDYERLMTPSAPFIYVFAALLMEKIFLPQEQKKFVWMTAIFLLIALSSNFYHLWGIVLLPGRGASFIATIITGTAMAALFFIGDHLQKTR